MMTNVFANAAVAAAIASGATLQALADGDEVASAAFSGFRLDTTGGTIVMATPADATLLSDWPVTYRAGETVTATAPDGAVVTLAAASSSDGSIAFTPTTCGLWRLATSESETALVGVGWDVFGESRSYASVAAGQYAMHTIGDGPDRKLKKSEVPPVAYSGDDWAGDLSKAATVTFTPPEGSGLAATTWNKTGRGASAFTFNKKGVWTVALTFADNTTRTAHIDIQTAGFVLIVK